MKIVVAGGGLQGSEAAYLAIQAGWSTVLIDRRQAPPASGLCDRQVVLDLLDDGAGLEQLLGQADLVVPALEDEAALQRLQQAAGRVGVPLAHDAAAYAITVSKQSSDALFAQYGIPAPAPWPTCSLPVIAKPSESSGSRGVRLITRPGEIEPLLAAAASGEQWVVQEFLEGDSYSIEVLGCQGEYLPLQVTGLEMDPGYDCRRVTAPAKLPPARVAEFQALAAKIAGLVHLSGVMDVEVIDHHGMLKVLEIDARLPSQTPAAVYASTGINILEALSEIFVRHRLPALLSPVPAREVIYEHVLVAEGRLEALGEHVISTARPLRLQSGFFGADEAITDYDPGAGRWVATLIHRGGSAAETWARRGATIREIGRSGRLSISEDVLDQRPEL
jgi:pyrrolysine biosynthesis protein PylC